MPRRSCWTVTSGLSVDDELSYLREFKHITLARVLIAQYAREHDDRLPEEMRSVLWTASWRRRRLAGGWPASSKSWPCGPSRTQRTATVRCARAPETGADPGRAGRLRADLRGRRAAAARSAAPRRCRGHRRSLRPKPAGCLRKAGGPRDRLSPCTRYRPCRTAHGAGSRDPAACCRGHAESRDRRPPGDQPVHGQASHRQHVREAGCQPSHRRSRPGERPGPALERRSSTAVRLPRALYLLAPPPARGEGGVAGRLPRGSHPFCPPQRPQSYSLPGRSGRERVRAVTGLASELMQSQTTSWGIFRRDARCLVRGTVDLDPRPHKHVPMGQRGAHDPRDSLPDKSPFPPWQGERGFGGYEGRLQGHAEHLPQYLTGALDAPHQPGVARGSAARLPLTAGAMDRRPARIDSAYIPEPGPPSRIFRLSEALPQRAMLDLSPNADSEAGRASEDRGEGPA